MLLYFLRAFLVLALLAVSMSYVEKGTLLADLRPYLIIGAVVLAALVIAFDSLVPRKSLKALSGVFFGLVVGLLITYGVSLVLDLLVSAFRPDLAAIEGHDQPAIAITKVLMGIIWCYLCVSFILQTKDDIRFVIPYVEFAKQIKGQRPLILDTSVIIDGRIADIAETGIIDQPLIVPRFVLQELQAVADSSDRLKRNRGRRGLDVLNKLQGNHQIEVQIHDGTIVGPAANDPVDLKLLALATQVNGRVATNDFNLNKLAKLRGVQIINLNDLTNALKSVVLVGETMVVKIIKAGEEPGQGIAYLDDGTMIVVDQARQKIGEAIDITVTSVLQTSAGRMIFGRMDGAPSQPRRRSPSEQV